MSSRFRASRPPAASSASQAPARAVGTRWVPVLLSSLLFTSTVSAAPLPAARWESWDVAVVAARNQPGRDGEGVAGDSILGFRLRRLPLTFLAGIARLEPVGSNQAAAAPPVRASFSTRPPVRPEEDGVRLGDAPRMVAETGAEVVRGAWSLQARLRLLAVSGGPWAGRISELNAVRAGRRHTWAVGRSPVRWGYGVQGGLLLGRSAPPLWRLAWTTTRPLSLPRPRVLGTWSGDVFLAYLDDDHRAVPRPLLLGHRLAWQPARWLELAGARTILFGGSDRTRRLTAGDLGNILLGRRENLVGARGPSDSDQRASFEACATLPASAASRLGLGGQLYFEYAGEDMIDPPIPAAVGHLFGAAATRAGWQARLEFAETVSRNRWYDRHGIYRDAHFYRGAPLGVSFGPDVESTWLGVTTPPSAVRLRLSRTETLLGKITGNRECRVGWSALARFDLRRACVIEGEWEGTRRIGPGREPLAPPLVRHAVLLRVTVG